MKFILAILLPFVFVPKVVLNTTSIIWVDHLSGDFSFKKRQSIVCEAWCYEWAGTDEVKVERISKDTVHCYTMMNDATHCSLNLIFIQNNCFPTIELKSIVPNGDKIYHYKSGWIKIDKSLWNKNILKAEFDFDFKNAENEKRIFWKGKIYKKLKKKSNAQQQFGQIPAEE